MRFSLAFTVVALAAAATGSPGAQAGPKFLGWHPSGAFAYVVDAAAVRVCREDTTDVPTGWPEGVSVGPGAACGDLPAQLGTLSAVDYAKKDVKGTKTEKKSPFGLDVKVEQKDNHASVVVTDGPDKKLKVGDMEDALDTAAITDVQWRPDGRAVAVTLELKKSKKSQVFVDSVAKLLVGGPAGRKVAERLHDEGMKLYKKRDWSGAGKKFEGAIDADADWAPARYARAAAEAQGGVGRTAMIDNLQWLKEHADKDAAAKKLLGQAKTDSAFDAWIGDPEVRELVGMPKVSSMDVMARLLERDGTWTVQGATCKSPWMTLQFKKGGAAQLTVADSCKGKKTSKSAPAAVKQTPAGPFQLEIKKPIDGMTLPAKSTLVLDESYQQLKLQPEGGGDVIGTFEPGAAKLDDSTL